MRWWGNYSLLALASAGVLGLGQGLAPVAASADAHLIVPESVYRLCDRRQFTRAEVRALQQRPDYELILRFTGERCAGVAAVLSDGATASLPGSAGATGAATGSATGGPAVSRGTAATGQVAECRPGLGLADSCDPICERTRFTTREIAALQRRSDFAMILEYTLAQCPAVAAVLTGTPTATLPGSGSKPAPDGGDHPAADQHVAAGDLGPARIHRHHRAGAADQDLRRPLSRH